MRQISIVFLVLAASLVGLDSYQDAAVEVAGEARSPDNAPAQIRRGDVGVVIIDAQPAFFKIMAGKREPVESRIEQLLYLSTVAALPCIATFESPRTKDDWFPDRLEKAFPKHGIKMVKHQFGCCREPEIKKAILAMGKKQVVVAGAETDVCVLQSVLGMLEMGLEVFILEDCLFTNEASPGPALERMYAAGAIPCTFKTFFYEQLGSVANDAFPAEWKKRESKLGKAFRSPYALPSWTRDK